ncbi:MAG: hypothetical protein WD077_05180 [Bacteroidia bacterium]
MGSILEWLGVFRVVYSQQKQHLSLSKVISNGGAANTVTYFLLTSDMTWKRNIAANSLKMILYRFRQKQSWKRKKF